MLPQDAPPPPAPPPTAPPAPPPPPPKEEVIPDDVWRLECLQIAMAMKCASPHQVASIALELGSIILEADSNNARHKRLRAMTMAANRFHGMKEPTAFAPYVRTLCEVVVEDLR